MSLPTWGDLAAFYCSNKSEHNPYFEEFSVRRYNYASSLDRGMCRLVFLKDVLKDKSNKTLCRSGRFIWCKKLRYEGRNEEGFRQVSFTVDRGKKRFSVSENNVLCVPSKVYVGNNKYFRSKLKTPLDLGTFSQRSRQDKIRIKNTLVELSLGKKLLTSNLLAESFIESGLVILLTKRFTLFKWRF